MALDPNRQTAYDTLRELMLQEQPTYEKGVMSQLQKMGIAQSPVGANILRSKTSDYWKPLTQFGGQLAGQQAVAKETAQERASQRSFQSAEAEKNRKWNEALIRWQVGQQEEMANKAYSRQKKDMWTQLGLSAGLGALGGGLGLMGAGTGGLGGALKGGLFGSAGVSSIAGQNIGMTQLLKLFKSDPEIMKLITR